jgi:hypothetical protein
MHGNVVKMSGQRGKVEIEGADLGSPAGGLLGCIYNLAQSVLLEGATSQIQISTDAHDCD